MGERKFTIDNEAQSLTSSFGIVDTKEIGSEELSNFLTDNASSVKADPKTIVSSTEDEEIEEKESKTVKKSPKVQTEEIEKKSQESLKQFFNDDSTEGEVETSDTEEENESPKNKEEDSTNIFSKLSKDLIELNIFSHTEGEPEIKTAQDFLNKFNTEKEQQAYSYIDNFLSQFGDDYKEAFEAIYINGVDPREYFTTAANIQSFKDLDLKSKHNQERIFKEYWKQQGLSEEKISKKLERALDFDTLEEDAIEFHEVLLAREESSKQKLVEERKAKEAQKRIEDEAFKNSLTEVLNRKIEEKEIGGIPLSQKEAEEIFDYMYAKKWKLPNGELLTDQEKEFLELKDPRNLELRIKHALLQKRKYDISKIVKTGISKKADSLFTNVAREEKTSKSQFKAITGSKSFF